MKAISIAALMTALTAQTATAATFDAFSSFNGTQLAGNFFYGKSSGTFTSFNSNSGCGIPNVICLNDGVRSNPGVYKSLIGAFPFSTIRIPGDALLVHPGDASNLVLGFQAPVAGTYSYTAEFFLADTRPTGVAITPFLARTGSPVDLSAFTFLSASTPRKIFTGQFSLRPFDAFGFSLNKAIAFNNDSTGVRFSVSSAAVPEPAAWALMLGGFGLVGAAARRRAKLQVTYT
jgi:hypothetical protein